MLAGIWNFLDSTFFLSITTIGLALSAYLLYKKQLADQKQNAASLIYLEVKNAEKQLKEAKKSSTQFKVLRDSGANTSGKSMFPERLQVMKTDNWNKYRHLFSRDISAEALNEIDEFYLNCRFFDESLAYIDANFSKNETAVRTNTFRIVANQLDKALRSLKLNPKNDPTIEAENTATLQRAPDLREAFTSSFPTLYSYAGVKPFQDAEYYAELLFASKLTSVRLATLLRVNLTEKS